MPKTNNLSINVPAVAALQSEDATTRSGLASPRTPHTPLTPRSPANGANNTNGEQSVASSKQAQYGDGYDNHVHSPINALPPPPSPRSPRVKTSKIFGNKLASKSASKLIKADASPRLTQSPGTDAPPQIYLNSQNNVANKSSPDISQTRSGQSSPEGVEFNSDSVASNDTRNKDIIAKEKKHHKFGNFLNRKASLRGDETLPPPSASSATSTSNREKPKPGPIKSAPQPVDVPMRTAPVEKERGFRSAMNSALRNRSLDRSTQSGSEEERGPPPTSHAYKPSQLGSNGLPANQSSSLVSNLRSGGNKAAGGISKAKKGLFGNFKLTRSASEKEGVSGRDYSAISREPYELKVLILPLEEQARITRIAKRLHYCKDKTEFWLPAFPYRCIDYLSDRGTYSEGLYRIPGSELEIKHYMARFDREYDLDLFEQEDLHDVNVVATMLKRWLSNLPPVLSQDLQSDIIRNCSESHPAITGNSTPDYMKQKLSELPPWNYYLLFAITGHISFLHNHREQNKMTYENLFRCFATRALQVEPYIFWWLVWDWRSCWLGCAREEEFKVKEYAILDGKVNGENGPGQGQPPSSSGSGTAKQSKPSEKKSTQQEPSPSREGKQQSTKPTAGSERPQTSQEKEAQRGNLSSSGSSKPSITGVSSTASTAAAGNIEEKELSVAPREENNAPLLSPLKPLSPIGNL